MVVKRYRCPTCGRFPELDITGKLVRAHQKSKGSNGLLNGFKGSRTGWCETGGQPKEILEEVED